MIAIWSEANKAMHFNEKRIVSSMQEAIALLEELKSKGKILRFSVEETTLLWKKE